MKIVRQVILLLSIVFMGEFLNKIVNIPLPGSVLGLLVLFALLLMQIIRLEQIEETSEFLMKHLAIFFVPVGVGLMNIMDVLKETWFLLLVISVTSSILVMSVTALVVQFMRRGKR